MGVKEKRRIIDMTNDPALRVYRINTIKEHIDNVRPEEYIEMQEVCNGIVGKLVSLAAEDMQRGIVGWDRAFGDDIMGEGDAFFICGKDLSRIDIEYIYDVFGYLNDNDGSASGLRDLFAEGRTVYQMVRRKKELSFELKYAMDFCRSSMPYGDNRRACENNLQALADADVVVRLILKAGAEPGTNDDDKRTGAGTVLVSIRGSEMPLQIARILRYAFDMDIARIESGDSITEGSCPVEFIRKGMAYLACLSRYDYDRDEEDKDDCGMPDSVEDEGDDEDFGGVPFVIDEDDIDADDMDPEKNVFIMDILDFSRRTRNCLLKANIINLDQLCRLTDNELKRIRGFNEQCLREVRFVVEHYGDGDRDIMENSQPRGSGIEQLEELVGLEEIKQQVKTILAYSKMKQDFQVSTRIPMSMNCAFLGNPGTAKTTVARIMAQFFYETGLLKSMDIVEVSRPGLVGKYVGHTAVLVKEVFDKADGRVLFIDEAYSLVDSYDGFSEEAVTTIVQEMENRRDRTIVICAGYPDLMEAFLNSNPGIRSRIPFVLNFRDYTPGELMKITQIEAGKRGFGIDPGTLAGLTGKYERMNSIAELGNGRLARNIAEKAILSYAYRVYGEHGSGKKDMILREEDFASAFMAHQPKEAKTIGFR